MTVALLQAHDGGNPRCRPRPHSVPGGNQYAQRCDQFEPPFDGNTVYSYHFYPEPILETGCYPVEMGGVLYARAWLEGTVLERARFMRDHGVPAWAGEFGPIFTGHQDEAGLHVIADMLDIIGRVGHHWTLWHYKDIGPMGVVTVDPTSEWIQRTQPVRTVKSALRCDPWIERQPTEIGAQLDKLIELIRQSTQPLAGNWQSLGQDVYAAVCQETISQALLPAFAEQFRGMSETEIDRMMQSFFFENCLPRERLATLLRAACR